jgi:hypothetical protein
MVATVQQHGAGDSGGLAKQGQPKERRRKAGQNEPMLREGDTAKARLVKTFREAGDVENNTAGK